MDKPQDKHIKLDNSEVVIAGMTLRDYFASAALSGMVAGSQGLAISRADFAKSSYLLADAMLEARKKVPTSC